MHDTSRSRAVEPEAVRNRMWFKLKQGDFRTIAASEHVPAAHVSVSKLLEKGNKNMGMSADYVVLVNVRRPSDLGLISH
jgi:hypothetical protein